MALDVFISHKSEDDQLARRVAAILERVGLTVYLDDFDTAARINSDITAHLINRIHECASLLALVTAHTKSSWWVPFEIGVATESPRAVASMTNLSKKELPDYLAKWPVLTDMDDVMRFAREFKTANLAGNRGYPTLFAKSVRSFENSLKAATGYSHQQPVD